MASIAVLSGSSWYVDRKRGGDPWFSTTERVKVQGGQSLPMNTKAKLTWVNWKMESVKGDVLKVQDEVKKTREEMQGDEDVCRVGSYEETLRKGVVAFERGAVE